MPKTLYLSQEKLETIFGLSAHDLSALLQINSSSMCTDLSVIEVTPHSAFLSVFMEALGGHSPLATSDCIHADPGLDSGSRALQLGSSG